jgi:hypothetical protein
VFRRGNKEVGVGSVLVVVGEHLAPNHLPCFDFHVWLAAVWNVNLKRPNLHWKKGCLKKWWKVRSCVAVETPSALLILLDTMDVKLKRSII